MKAIVGELKSVIHSYAKKLGDLSEEDFSAMPGHGKWSKKEELGHLLDSAHTNLRRFVVAQYESEPKIVYEQELWVQKCAYQQQPTAPIISFWILLNEQICSVLASMPVEMQERLCDTGKHKKELHPLSWLAQDYVKHILHHLHHILELEPVPYG